MVSSTSIKKKRTKRSKKESIADVEEEVVTPPHSVDKSKKKKGKKSKIETSKTAHTMDSLYLDPIDDKPQAPEKTNDQIQSNAT
jgi:hypothetical protein